MERTISNRGNAFVYNDGFYYGPVIVPRRVAIIIAVKHLPRPADNKLVVVVQRPRQVRATAAAVLDVHIELKLRRDDVVHALLRNKATALDRLTVYNDAF